MPDPSAAPSLRPRVSPGDPLQAEPLGSAAHSPGQAWEARVWARVGSWHTVGSTGGSRRPWGYHNPAGQAVRKPCWRRGTEASSWLWAQGPGQGQGKEDKPRWGCRPCVQPQGGLGGAGGPQAESLAKEEPDTQNRGDPRASEGRYRLLPRGAAARACAPLLRPQTPP